MLKKKPKNVSVQCPCPFVFYFRAFRIYLFISTTCARAVLHTSDGAEVKIIIVTDDGIEPIFNDKEEISKSNCLIVPKRHSFKLNKTIESMVKNERSASLDPLQFDANQFDVSKRRASSISSLGNWTGAVVVSDATDCVRKKTNEKWQMVVDFLDLTLLNDLVYVNIVLGISFALYSDVAFFTLQPMYLFHLGYSKVLYARHSHTEIENINSNLISRVTQL